MKFFGSQRFQFRRSTFFLSTVKKTCRIKLFRQRGNLPIVRRRNRYMCSSLGDVKVTALTQTRYFLPRARRLRVLAGLDGIYNDAFSACQRNTLWKFNVVLIIHMGWRIADQEYRFVACATVAPRNLLYCVVQGLINAFGTITATLRFEVHQGRVHAVEIFREIEHFRNISITTVAEGDEAHFNFRRRFSRGHR